MSIDLIKIYPHLWMTFRKTWCDMQHIVKTCRLWHKLMFWYIMGGIAQELWMSIPVAVIYTYFTIILIMSVAVTYDELRFTVKSPYLVINEWLWFVRLCTPVKKFFRNNAWLNIFVMFFTSEYTLWRLKCLSEMLKCFFFINCLFFSTYQHITAAIVTFHHKLLWQLFPIYLLHGVPLAY